MTTEIAIMNKSAVALAADSAVTIQMTRPQAKNYKVLNTANKLFTLSKYAPVGLMVNGNSNIMGISWETIIKLYRKKLGERTFPTVEDYCKNFIEYLDAVDVCIEAHNEYVAVIAYGHFNEIRQKVDTWVKSQIEAGNTVSGGLIESQLSEKINEHYNEIEKLSEGAIHSKNTRNYIINKYTGLIKGVILKIFINLPISHASNSQLIAIAVNAASIGAPSHSEIVIAGFGENDIFPQCYRYRIAAIFEGKTIKRDGEVYKITHDNGAVIIPLAQADDVATFIEGIGPSLYKFLVEAFKNIFTRELPDRLRDEAVKILGLSDSQKANMGNLSEEMCKGAYDHVFEKFKELKRDNYINPVVNATSYLGKEELATMAETLVNLVSFRKQVTMEAETVGGPIDVAVITKGDGFVWIKRKHYFAPELNHHFFSNYYRREDKNG